MWLQIPQISPSARGGVCSVCGTEQNALTEGALTTGVEVEFEGFIEVCTPCVREAGGLIGMVPAERHEELEDDFLALKVWSDNAYEELAAKDETIRSLIRVIGSDADKIEALAASRPLVPEAPSVVLT